ncbi:MAG: VCBS repeat-containing protein [Fidelibacterota bacterium]|nr:MAG: VCBS repeat-containing protein [Candidatus Neomarinimicrobiota bacterium]
MIYAIVWALSLGCSAAQLLGQTSLSWRDVTEELGIASPGRLPPSGWYPPTETFKGHAVPFDVDRDGDLDLLLTYGPHVADSLYSGLNSLYRNDDTAWVDVTAETGLARFPPAGNAAVGDVNGDGFPDLYLCLFGTDRLLLNENGRRWHDMTNSAGISNDYWATDAVFFDANHDGFLDLYVANYLDYPRGDIPSCFDARTRQRTTCDPMMFEPAPNRLFLSDSIGRFHEATTIMGLADTTSRSLAVELLDANGDGYLDLFILSHSSPNLLYLGGADSGLDEVGFLSGVALAPDGSEPEWSQVLVLDADQNGHTDLMFARRDGEIHLLLNNGHGLFFEGHYQTGLFQPRSPFRATAAVALDVDFNSTIDLILADQWYKYVTDTLTPDMVIVDSLSISTDSLFESPSDSPVDSAQAHPGSPEIQFGISEAEMQKKAQSDKPPRILLSDEQNRFHSADVEAPMILDKALLVPRLTPSVEEDTSLLFMAEDTLGQLLFPVGPVEESYNRVAFYLPAEPAHADTALSVPSPDSDNFGQSRFIVDSGYGDTVAFESSLLGGFDSTLVDMTTISTAAPRADLPDFLELDTLRIFQEAERFVPVDLTGDGIEEMIATYPIGLFRIWKRVLEKKPWFIGLWLRTEQAGVTPVGAKITISSGNISRSYLVTDPNPVSFYFPWSALSADVLVRWPDGHENHYSEITANRTHILTRRALER